MSNKTIFLRIYDDIMNRGLVSSPRGQEIREIENYAVQFDSMDPCTSFPDRKFNLQYAKDEFKWYLGADRFDLSISEKAGTWKTLVDVDGGFNSNYGVYIFGQNQFQWCVEEMTRDQATRRAVIILANKDQIRVNNPDHICTYAISFRIRFGLLGMTVHMRSWDAIYGMTNDVFAFCLLHQMMLAKMRSIYPDLQMGLYHHTADSIHIYQRHYEMAKNILAFGNKSWYKIEIPELKTGEEVDNIIAAKGRSAIFNSEFYAWLMS